MVLAAPDGPARNPPSATLTLAVDNPSSQGRPCTGDRLTGDIRYLERVWDMARDVRPAGLSEETLLETPLERVLPPAPARSVPKGCGAAQRANLEKLWNEMATAR